MIANFAQEPWISYIYIYGTNGAKMNLQEKDPTNTIFERIERRHPDYGHDALSTRPCFNDKNLSHSASLSLCLHIANQVSAGIDIS